jgi:hypothetical protein
MRRLTLAILSALALGACGSSEPPESSVAAADAAAAGPGAPTATVDDEYERLKAVSPVDACATLTPEELKTIFPDLVFEVHERLDPRLSGYVWDSRCTYWAGVGTIDYAKDVPTHSVALFVATSVSEEKARANLAARHEGARTASGYQPQPALGADAYSTSNTGVVSLFLVKDQSEIQINVSDLETPNDQKTANVIALAGLL